MAGPARRRSSILKAASGPCRAKEKRSRTGMNWPKPAPDRAILGVLALGILCFSSFLSEAQVRAIGSGLSGSVSTLRTAVRHHLRRHRRVRELRQEFNSERAAEGRYGSGERRDSETFAGPSEARKADRRVQTARADGAASTSRDMDCRRGGSRPDGLRKAAFGLANYV